MTNLFDQCITAIGAKYLELGHKLGWRFLSVSKSVLDQNPPVALITLNPGGGIIPPDHPWASCEIGAAYYVECWGNSPQGQSNLQRQVQAMFQKISDCSDNLPKNERYLLENSLIGHFVPFRSPRLVDLENKKESFAFGEELWRIILSNIRPKLIICIDRESFARLRPILVDVVGDLESSLHLPTGWGTYQADLERYGEYGAVTLLRLPHLSTFKLFTSAKCRETVDRIFTEACKGL